MLRVGSFRHNQYVSPNSSSHTSPQTSPLASNLPSPFGSPFHSSTNSPNISPASSPMSLRRASVYKHKVRKSQPHRGTTEEIIRRKKEVCRTRSKSTPSLPGDFNENKSRRLTSQSSFSEGSMSEDYHSSSEKINAAAEQKKERRNHKDPNLRKKSLGAIISASLGHLNIKSDFKKVMDHAPKLRRSNSHRSTRAKQKEALKDAKTSFSDEDNENYDGPLFHAITLFVPGYDFKTKQSTPVIERKQSTPIFGRRGSKEKTGLPLFNRNSKERLSVPNLTMRRGSKEKIKKLEPKRYSDHFLQTEQFTNETLGKSKTEVSISQDTQSDDDFLSIVQRQNIIKDKYKKFESLGKNTAPKIDVAKENLEGKVKKLSGAFESGKAFLSKNEKRLSKTMSMDWNLVRDRTSSFEKNNQIKTKSNRAMTYACTNTTDYPSPDRNFVTAERKKRLSYGTESGYNSPNDISEDTGNHGDNLPDKNIQNLSHNTKKSILKNSHVVYDDSLSSSWSHGQWMNKNKNFELKRNPSTSRIYSTDLCVTEL